MKKKLIALFSIVALFLVAFYFIGQNSFETIKDSGVKTYMYSDGDEKSPKMIEIDENGKIIKKTKYDKSFFVSSTSQNIDNPNLLYISNTTDNYSKVELLNYDLSSKSFVEPKLNSELQNYSYGGSLVKNDNSMLFYYDENVVKKSIFASINSDEVYVIDSEYQTSPSFEDDNFIYYTNEDDSVSRYNKSTSENKNFTNTLENSFYPGGVEKFDWIETVTIYDDMPIISSPYRCILYTIDENDNLKELINFGYFDGQKHTDNVGSACIMNTMFINKDEMLVFIEKYQSDSHYDYSIYKVNLKTFENTLVFSEETSLKKNTIYEPLYVNDGTIYIKEFDINAEERNVLFIDSETFNVYNTLNVGKYNGDYPPNNFIFLETN